MSKQVNPFYSYSHDGRDFFAIGTDDRLRALKTFTLQECRAALALTNLQKSVRTALESRAKKLGAQ